MNDVGKEPREKDMGSRRGKEEKRQFFCSNTKDRRRERRVVRAHNQGDGAQPRAVYGVRVQRRTVLCRSQVQVGGMS